MSYLGATNGVSLVAESLKPIDWTKATPAALKVYTDKANDPSADVIGDMQRKVAAGQPLSDAERAYLVTYTNLGAKMVNGMIVYDRTIYGSDGQYDPILGQALGIGADGRPRTNWSKVVTSTSNPDVAGTPNAAFRSLSPALQAQVIDAGWYPGLIALGPDGSLYENAAAMANELALKARIVTLANGQRVLGPARTPAEQAAAAKWAARSGKAESDATAAANMAATGSPYGLGPDGLPIPFDGRSGETLRQVFDAVHTGEPAIAAPVRTTLVPSGDATDVSVHVEQTTGTSIDTSGASGEPAPPDGTTPPAVATPGASSLTSAIAKVPMSVWIGGALVGAYLLARRSR